MRSDVYVLYALHIFNFYFISNISMEYMCNAISEFGLDVRQWINLIDLRGKKQKILNTRHQNSQYSIMTFFCNCNVTFVIYLFQRPNSTKAIYVFEKKKDIDRALWYSGSEPKSSRYCICDSNTSSCGNFTKLMSDIFLICQDFSKYVKKTQKFLYALLVSC